MGYINQKEEKRRLNELKGLRKVNTELEKQVAENSRGSLIDRVASLEKQLSGARRKENNNLAMLKGCQAAKDNIQDDLASLTFEVALYNELSFFEKLKLAFSNTGFFQIIR